MKNTILSLDILFISENNVIVDLVKETLPLSEKIHTSKVLVKYILEINSGLIDKKGISIGDEVNIEYKEKLNKNQDTNKKNNFYIDAQVKFFY